MKTEDEYIPTEEEIELLKEEEEEDKEDSFLDQQEYVEDYGHPSTIKIREYRDEEIKSIWEDTLKEKMGKLKNLLGFYKKNGTKIKFRLIDKPYIELKGEVKEVKGEKFYRGNSFLVIKDEDKPKVKVFLEDIDFNTVLPIEIEYVMSDILKKRIPLPSKLRFDVLNRDNHTCKYCGKQPPEVILEVDHVQPVSKGGKDDMENLFTSCRDCNRGKGATPLS